MGASTIVDEIAADPAFAGKAPPGAVAVSVGGAGLLCGVYEGLARHYPDAAAPDVLACETHGAASFAAGMQGRGGIDAIESIATSLGALEVVPKALALAKAHAGATELVGVSDAEAVAACGVLAREHRLLVEPACGAAAAVATLGLAKQYESLVIVVCGGSGVTPDILRGWEEEFLGNRYPT
jgi:L-serine/L-threonine ammonia-lyase